MSLNSNQRGKERSYQALNQFYFLPYFGVLRRSNQGIKNVPGLVFILISLPAYHFLTF